MVLVDEFLPVFDVSDELAVVVDADADATWAALLDADLIEVGRRRPLVGVLGALRVLPQVASELLHGERPPAAPERLALRDLTGLSAAAGGWILLDERADRRTLLSGVMRTATTDEHARRWFRRYWTLGVGSGAPGGAPPEVDRAAGPSGPQA